MTLDKKEIGNRLYKIRRVIQAERGEGNDQTRFANQMGVKNDTFSKWETGEILFPVAQAEKLLGQIPGLTLDWIYLGGFDLLRTPEAARLLREAPDKAEEPRRGKISKESADREAAALLVPLPSRKHSSRKRTV